MKKLDTVGLIVAMVGPLIAGVMLGVTGHGYWYLLTVVTFYCCFGLFEFISIKTRKKSISQDIGDAPPWLFWFLIATWTIMHVFITLHWYFGR